MKRAGYYLIDITSCGENYHLGFDRWKKHKHYQTYVDREWNMHFYTEDLREFDYISSAADYIVFREKLNSKLACPRKSKRKLKRLIPKPYYLEVKNRTLIEPR